MERSYRAHWLHPTEKAYKYVFISHAEDRQLAALKAKEHFEKEYGVEIALGEIEITEH